MSWNEAIPFFTEEELSCQGTGIIKLDIRFAVALPALRLDWGKPLSMSSVCRAPSHNKVINNGKGGHPRSLHLTENPVHPTDGTMAGDVIWRDWPEEEKLYFARFCWRRGWSVGLHDSFCHIDRRKDIGLMQASFLYGQWTGSFGTDDVMD